jgi:hypothetical protein
MVEERKVSKEFEDWYMAMYNQFSKLKQFLTIDYYKEFRYKFEDLLKEIEDAVKETEEETKPEEEEEPII